MQPLGMMTPAGLECGPLLANCMPPLKMSARAGSAENGGPEDVFGTDPTGPVSIPGPCHVEVMLRLLLAEDWPPLEGLCPSQGTEW